ncbi:hypothetical protein ACIQPR_01815 [Streptomyces sp. NPDC091280]|uniref:hypothetical protein n=1 Tax=unclassified Streptomyces TaxID=2593676 RepID=UPI00381E5334
MVFTGLAAAVWLVAAVIGVVAVTTGWTPPTTRGRVVRPELWGYGTLIAALGIGTGMSMRWWAGSRGLDGVGGATALALILLGFLLQWRAQRPAHPRHPTKNAS